MKRDVFDEWGNIRRENEKREAIDRVRREAGVEKRTSAIIAFSGGIILGALLTKLLLKK